jgi:hypothetical protein
MSVQRKTFAHTADGSLSPPEPRATRAPLGAFLARRGGLFAAATAAAICGVRSNKLCEPCRVYNGNAANEGLGSEDKVVVHDTSARFGVGAAKEHR